MDIKTISRNLPHIVLILCLLLSPSETVKAQSDCAYEAYITGTYPPHMPICIDYPDPYVTAVAIEEGPCNAAIHEAQDVIVHNQHNVLRLIPGGPITSDPRAISFIFAAANPYKIPYSDPVTFLVRSYNHLGILESSESIVASPITSGDFSEVGIGFAYYYAVTAYVLDVGFPTEFTIQVTDPEPVDIPYLWFFSIHHRFLDEAINHCDITNGSLPTSTPSPTPTTDAGGEPTHSPTPSRTAQSTAVHTPVPNATATGVGLSTIPAETVPTAWSTGSAPSVSIPTINIPNLDGLSTPQPISVQLTPNATTSARNEAIATSMGHSGLVLTRWYTASNTFSFDTSITTTTGIASPATIADSTIRNMSLPITYLKSVSLYMPSTWRLVLALLMAFIWMVFVTITKFFIAVIADNVEIIRRIYEAIPFIG